ncbi:MAG: glycosyltransferase [Alphaproteobacteria bacterium]|nr:glycosyltransferase [Alphaproteobacteria bacterium]
MSADANTAGFLRGKKFLIVSALFPPDVLGGAEMTAAEQALWLAKNGAEVGVLTTAKNRDEVCAGKMENGLKVWRVWAPRPYPMFFFAAAKFWQKPLWHLQDHLDPRNRWLAAKVLDAFQPDYALVHVLQGLGYNVLKEIGRRNIPVVYFTHDLSLACLRTTMFKGGAECTAQCGACKISSAYKASVAAKIPHLAYCAPSRTHLEKLVRYFPVKARPHTAIFNANKYPAATVARTESDRLRILYVGRLHHTKGIQVLLAAAAELAKTSPLTVTVAGAGPDEEALRAQYGDAEWCHFAGFLPQTEISNLMIGSDVLVMPSLVAESLGGSAVHALTLGLPVIGSDIGGIPELVSDGKNGLLVAPGDQEALRAALEKVTREPALLENWRAYALADTRRFDQDYLGKQIVDLVRKLPAA